jgi:hypothetical protein
MFSVTLQNGFGEPSSDDFSHAPPAKGNSLCFRATRSNPRQLAVLAKGWMTITKRCVVCRRWATKYWRNWICCSYACAGIYRAQHYELGIRTHRATHTRLYQCYWGMKSRCDPNTKHKRNRKLYVERGITVCRQWSRHFEPFRDWALAHGYADNLVLDRIDANKNYRPSNCRWVTHHVSRTHKRPIREWRRRKYTVSQILRVRELRRRGVQLKAVSRITGVKLPTVRMAVYRRQWWWI